MIANYHTHTYRCGHAEMVGERAYVEKAIELGIKELGFSDHMPTLIPEAFDKAGKDNLMGSRMKMSGVEEYVNSILRLKEEYKDDIKIHVGFEAEYFESVFEENLKLISRYPVDYIILGQHCSDFDKPYKSFAKQTSSEEILVDYVDQVIKGLSTGKFTYLAHPDIINYRQNSLDVYEREMTRLIKYCNSIKIPLEINLLGLQEVRNYPLMQFWQIASNIGCDVVIGSDAHYAKDVCDATALRLAENMLSIFDGLNLLETVEFKPIS